MQSEVQYGTAIDPLSTFFLCRSGESIAHSFEFKAPKGFAAAPLPAVH